MSVTDKIKSFFDKRGSGYDRTHLTFPQLNADKIKLQMRLKEEGLERGKKNLPPTAALGFDDIEQKIISHIDNHVKSATEAYYDDLRSFDDRMNRLNAMGHLGKIESIAISAEGDFKSHVHKRKDQLYTARAVVTGREADLNEFKKMNDLRRSARYPQSRLLYFSVAALLVVIETYINGMFFAKGHEQGIIGGFFTALIPSLLNVSIGYYLGNFAFRLAVHRHWLRKFSGIFLCLLLPALVFTLNILVAHYRSAMIDLMGDGSAQAAKTALSTFIATPFALTDVESWFLFAMGCIFSLIATVDFWKMDDPYLHFGEISRDHKSKLDEYANMKSDALEELEDVRNDRLYDLEEACNLMSAKSSEASAVFDSQKRWEVLFKDHLTHLENIGKELLGYYQTANMGVRTEKPPKYFQRVWSLERLSLPEAGVDFLRMLNGFQAELANVQGAHADCSRRIAKAYDSAQDAYQTIDQLKPEELKKWLTGNVDGTNVDNLAAAA